MMYNNQPYTHLSLNGIHTLIFHRKHQIVLQLLRPQKLLNPSNSGSKYSVILSDGFTQHNAILAFDAAVTFEKALEPGHCVVLVHTSTPSLQRNVFFVIITKLEIINPWVDIEIGEPIDYQIWLNNNQQNPKGRNEIPLSFPKNVISTINYTPNLKDSYHIEEEHSLLIQNGFSSKNELGNIFGQFPLNGLSSLLFEKGKRIIVQLLNVNKLNHQASIGLRYSVYISDGFIKQKALLVGSAALNFQKAGEPSNCIVYVDDVMIGDVHESQRLVLITKITMFNHKISNVVGDPKEKLIVSTSLDIQALYPRKRTTNVGQTEETDNDDDSRLFSSPDDLLAALEAEYLSLSQITCTGAFLTKVRVTKKSGSKCTPQNSPYFSTELTDNEGKCILAYFFKEAAFFFFDIILNGVYFIGNGIFKENHKGKDGKSHLVFDRADTFIWKINDESEFPLKFQFISLKRLKDVQANSYVDVTGFIEDIDCYQEIELKYSRKTRTKRTISFYDNSGFSVQVVVWDTPAKDFCLQKGDTIIFKSARVQSHDGMIRLFAANETRILNGRNYISQESWIQVLLDWKKTEIIKGKRISLSEPQIYTIEQIKQALSKFEGKRYFDLIAYITYIKEQDRHLFRGKDDKCYQCGSKLIVKSIGYYEEAVCAKCDEAMDIYHSVLNFNKAIQLSDHTGSICVSTFNHVTAVILGSTAKDIVRMNQRARRKIFEEAIHKEYRFTLAVTVTFDYHKNRKIEIRVKRIEKLSYLDQSKKFLIVLAKHKTF